MGKNDFYLGRVVDPSNGETTDTPLQYDPDDLTTHAVIVGMTGSGKTGLCLDLMEEAGLHKTPVLMLDPKGDITNAVLHFPNLAPADFEPWINADEAKRSGKTAAEAAEGTADLWRNGLASWDIGSDRIQQLKDSVQFSIYTPGSDAGLSISILSSLAAPDIDWDENQEVLREQIGGTVTAILGLAGMTDVDPVQDREHILLANIFEKAWSEGNDLTLEELILQTQNPPFEKLGVFDVKMLFPDKERFKLAMQLNNILAAPSFQNWIKGEPLDIEKLLYMPDGQPRHTIFYLAHLNDDERMFFVTLMYSAVETWMRTQAGTGSLRALVYFDEIFGYLPPIGNPPSKEPMLRLLKQARAFGVGMVLATQNPVDIDYKALSNAGTWFIGKLGTDQDKNRLLDGLESASGAGLDRREYDRLISGIGKRVFLLRNVHEKAPALFQTRWAMNYLAGPMTRTQIPALNALAGVDEMETEAAPAAKSSGRKSATRATAAVSVEPKIGTSTRPAVPSAVNEFFLPIRLSLTEAADAARRDVDETGEEPILYRPVLIAQAEVLYNQTKYDINSTVTRTVLVPEPHEKGLIDWESYVNLDEVEPAIEMRDFEDEPTADALFGELEKPFTNARSFNAIEKKFVDYLYRESPMTILANTELKAYGQPGMSEADFKEVCMAAAKEKAKEEVDKEISKIDKKIDSAEKKLKKEERELAEDEAELQGRRREEGMKAVETLFGMVTGRRKSLSSTMTKRRMTAKAKADVEESQEEIEALEKEIAELEDQKEDALEMLMEKWEAVADDVSTIEIKPYKKDIHVTFFGVAWLPHYVTERREFEAFRLD